MTTKRVPKDVSRRAALELLGAMGAALMVGCTND
jgi:hypothetical protein